MSTNPAWDRARELLHEALELEPGARDAYLRDKCGGDTALLAEVQSLLTWVNESEAFLETPAVRVTDLMLAAPDADLLIGQSLGPWRIVDVVGHGGMGVVYRAERADAAFRRVVAVKVVRRAAHAADIIERFHRERETLAALDHPNIARLIDGGSTPDGQPYFVMEYVDGVRMDRYCDEQHLTIDERLDLFRMICSAVQYAHHALVVHRDIKPDNILVARDGTPKLLDFGIARVLSDESTRPELDVHAAATWILTPDYASPEQITGGTITTASDVYSLGVLLHVLLTGRAPYRLKGATQQDLRAQLATATLAPPSESFRADASDADARAAARGSTPAVIARRITGDLDAIVARALARDLRVRYQSVEQLVDEIDRHRRHEPVSARGQDWWYLTGRFVRRHRLGLSLAGAFLCLLLAGTGGVLWQASIAAEERDRAERRFEEGRRLARAFIFDLDNEIVSLPGTTRARAMMMRTASQYLEGLAREAHGDLELQRELASAFVKVGDAQGHPTSANVGDTAGARASYERAIEIAGSVRAAAPADVEVERTRAMAHRRLSDVLAWGGDTSAALTHLETSQRLFTSIAAQPGATIDDRLQAAIGTLKLGDLYGNPNLPNMRQPEAASARYATALQEFRALTEEAPDDQRVARYLGLILERIGTMHEVAQNWSAAAIAYQESFDIRRTLAATPPVEIDVQRDFAIAYEKLGNVQLALGNVAAAEASYRGALAEFERLAEADPSNAIAARTVAISRERLAGTMLPQGRRSDAVKLLSTALETHRRLAAADPANAQARCDVARLEESLGDTWAAPGAGVSTATACGYWRRSVRARQELRRDEVSCVTAADEARVVGKAQSCR